MRNWLVAFALTLCITSTSLAQPYTRFPTPGQYPTGGPKIKLAVDQTCTQCESGPYWVDGFGFLHVDCDGFCTVHLVCRPQGATHDAILATIQITDSGQQMEPNGMCDMAYLRIADCTPTATSPICKVRAWLY